VDYMIYHEEVTNFMREFYELLYQYFMKFIF
jgi:hypothetical protein